MASVAYALMIVVLLSLVFDYINGFHDTANAIATVVSTRALSPRQAVMLSAILNFVGALYNTTVAKTIAQDIVSVSLVTVEVVIGALIGAIIWNLLTWYFGIPSSSSHAIIGGVIGAAIVKAGPSSLQWAGIDKIALALVTAPILGGILGLFITYLLLLTFGHMPPSKVNSNFRKVQIFTAALLSFNHGSNDAQKSMGIITLALLSAGMITTPEVPLWVKLACASAMTLGTAAGGWRIIRTLGSKIFKIEPIFGCSAELSASTIIWLATIFGLPISTTHVVTGSIIGVGAVKRLSAVRWGVAREMFIAWLLTIPASALMGGIVYYFIHLVLG
ncbi:MAG: inorganic phosphate transporter [Desulfitobacteriaceae bacterium]